jgi:hypothetical protein
MPDFTRKTRIYLLVAMAMAMATLTMPSFAQNQNAGGGLENSASQAGANDVIGQRIHRQHLRINHALKSGLISEAQANNLRNAVNEIASEVQELRQKNGGVLKSEEIKQFENSLNQSSDQIRTVAEAGNATVQSGKVLGPTWTKGADGAQNPKSLLQQMKQENKRELRQERQNTEQKIEQQQLQYEREMIEHLGEQKQDILKGKEDLKDVRKESGAD